MTRKQAVKALIKNKPVVLINKRELIHITKLISIKADSFDQETKGQCRKLARLIKAQGRVLFTLESLLIAMSANDFTFEFIKSVADEALDSPY